MRTEDLIAQLALDVRRYVDVGGGIIGHVEIAMQKLAAAVAEAEREACAKVAESKATEYLSPEYATGQPLSSFSERFACKQVAEAIRARTS